MFQLIMRQKNLFIVLLLTVLFFSLASIFFYFLVITPNVQQGVINRSPRDNPYLWAIKLHQEMATNEDQ